MALVKLPHYTNKFNLWLFMVLWLGHYGPHTHSPYLSPSERNNPLANDWRPTLIQGTVSPPGYRHLTPISSLPGFEPRRVASDTHVAMDSKVRIMFISVRVFVLFWNSFIHGYIIQGYRCTIKLTCNTDMTMMIECFSTVLHLADPPDNLVPVYQTHLHTRVCLTHPLVVCPTLQHDTQMSNHREWVHWVPGSWD